MNKFEVFQEQKINHLEKKHKEYIQLVKHPSEINDIYDFYGKRRSELGEKEVINQWAPRKYDIRRFVKIAEIIKERKKENKPIKILDVGCGSGLLSKLIVEEANRQGIDVEIIAIDPDEKLLDEVKDKFRNTDNLNFKVIDLEEALNEYGPILDDESIKKLDNLRKEEALNVKNKNDQEIIKIRNMIENLMNHGVNRIDIVINSWMPTRIDFSREIRYLNALVIIYAKALGNMSSGNSRQRYLENKFQEKSYQVGENYKKLDEWEGFAIRHELYDNYDHIGGYEGWSSGANQCLIHIKKDLNIDTGDIQIPDPEDSEKYAWEKSIEKFVGQERVNKKEFYSPYYDMD